MKKYLSKSTVRFLFQAFIAFATYASSSASAQSGEGRSQNFTDFANRAAQETGYSRAEIVGFLEAAKYRPDIIEAINRPAEDMPWFAYEKKVVTAKKIDAGVQFLLTYGAALAAAEKTFGVPREVITAIIGVESGYGVNRGRIPVMDSLVTLGFNFPRREKFFKSELIEFLRQCKASGQEPSSILGSYAGAMGWPQFMPSSVKRLAIDYDGDGKIDLIDNPIDSIGSVANYLSKSGWQMGALSYKRVSRTEKESVQLVDESGPIEILPGRNFKAILRYNRSRHYAMAVLRLSDEIAIRVD